MQHVENELDQTIEKLSSTNTKFDEKDKAFQLAEGESQALSRKLVLEEAEFERTESTLVTITAELTEKSNLADTINKAIKVLETKNMIDEESKQKNSYPSSLFRTSNSVNLAKIYIQSSFVFIFRNRSVGESS